MTRDDLRGALGLPNVAAFLAVIDRGEHGPHAESADRYRTLYGGQLFDAPPWEHPRRKVTAGRWTSTAAGRGQFLAGTWDALVARYQFPDFSPDCQDEAMVALIHGRKALEDVIAGRFEAAIAKCAREWASLPGSPYGQPTLTMDEARAVYEAHGGAYEAEAAPAFDPDSLGTERYEGPEPNRHTPPTKEAPMPAPLLIPIVSALLPSIVNLIPALAGIFKPGSEVAQRNVAAATMVGQALVEATQTPNLQAAVERMQQDPEALESARRAMDELIPSLVEVGGGVVAARKQAADPTQTPPWMNPAVWVAILVLPLVYMAAGAVLLGWGGQPFSDDVKALVVTALFTGALGAITGFFLGSSLGSQRKTEMKGNA